MHRLGPQGHFFSFQFDELSNWGLAPEGFASSLCIQRRLVREDVFRFRGAFPHFGRRELFVCRDERWYAPKEPFLFESKDQLIQRAKSEKIPPTFFPRRRTKKNSPFPIRATQPPKMRGCQQINAEEKRVSCSPFYSPVAKLWNWEGAEIRTRKNLFSIRPTEEPRK